MRDSASVHELCFEEVSRVGLQFRAWQNRFPGHVSFTQIFLRQIRGVNSLKRTTLGKIAFEVSGINFELTDLPRRAEFDDRPIVTRAAAALGFPTITHVGCATGHDQIVSMTKKHITAG